MEKENKDVFKEYAKFLKQDVVVKYHQGDAVEELEGNLRFLSFHYLSCVVMTEKEKIIIKNVISISRKRNAGEKKEENA